MPSDINSNDHNETKKIEQEVLIHDLARGGAGVGKLPDGRIIFVPFTAPGDRVRVKIEQSKKNFVHGKVIEILEPSEQRVSPQCSVFGRCGGCDWQHIPYALQFSTKSNGTVQALARAGIKFDKNKLEKYPAEKIWNYRNKIQLRGKGAEIGFYGKGTNEIVPIDHCAIADERLNNEMPKVREKGKTWRGEFKAELSVNSNNEVQLAWNLRHSALGFEQVHTEQNQKLRNFVKETLINLQNNHGDILLDLYGGNGNLSELVWSAYQQCHVVDIGAPTSAPKNLDQTELRYWKSSVLTWLQQISTLNITPNRPVDIIFDPPREGLGDDHSEIKKHLSKLNVSRIVHIGCDPDSFARDVANWVRYGFDIQKIAVFDLFPQTTHIESVAFLTASVLASKPSDA